MGGNALKNTFTRRYSADEYYKIIPEVELILQDEYKTRVAALPSYRDKADFGDADILLEKNVSTSGLNDKEIIQRLFGPNEIVVNGNVISFDYKQLQIDVIRVGSENFESSLAYYSHSDLGNLIGRIFHKIGVKYGHQGLDLVVRLDENQHVLSEINLTKSIDEILPLIGLSVKKFKSGFDSLEDIFLYVASSSFFDPDIYLFHNRNHAAKIRDKKRMAYNRFLEWIQTENPPAMFQFQEKSEKGGYNIREPFYSEIIVPAFPWIEESVAKMIVSFELRQNLKKVYNGQVIYEMTGLHGKELGTFMKKYRLNASSWSDEEIQYWLKNIAFLLNLVKNSFEDYRNEKS